MKRDKDLILKLLRWVRDTADGKKMLEAPDCRDHDPAVVQYHIKLRHEASFVDARCLGQRQGSARPRPDMGRARVPRSRGDEPDVVQFWFGGGVRSPLARG